MITHYSTNELYARIAQLLEQSRKQVLRAVNSQMVYTYYTIGQMIVEDEQNGNQKAEYGRELIVTLAKRLTEQFGRGFSEVNLRQMRTFFLTYSIQQTLSAEFALSWSHYLKLMRITDEAERRFYEIEAIKHNWSLRELQRQCDSALYTRLQLSRNKEEIKRLSQEGLTIQKPKDAVKDPYILEFLGLEERASYSESDLERTLIDKLEEFLLELGTGFTFVSRQDRITLDEQHFYIDLVFFNRLLSCFVLIDLKIGELKHQDLGQMQMYVNYYDRFKRLETENKTIGIVLCRDKSDALVEITLPDNNEQIFASRYLTVLPKKEDLVRLLQEKE